MKRLLALSVVALLLSSRSAAALAILPEASLLVNGQSVGIPAEWRTDDGKHWFLQLSTTPAAVFPIETLVVTANSDPFLNFAVGFINPFAAPTSFVLTLLVPYVGGPYNQVELSHSSTATDGDAAGGATVSLNTDPNIANALVDAVIATGQSTGCTITPPPNSQGCFSGADSVVAFPTGAAGLFGARLNFVLSNNDLYSATGRVELATVVAPEPATVLLFASGLGVALRRRFVR